jgi:hypothetical protein
LTFSQAARASSAFVSFLSSSILSNCCASFLSASAKKGGSCTDVILGAIIIGGIIIAVQARRYESPRPVVGDAPMSIGGRFLSIVTTSEVIRDGSSYIT